MKMEFLKIFVVLMVLVIGLFVFILGYAVPCSAQFFLYPPIPSVFNPTFYPFTFNSFIPPLPTLSAPILSPLLSPYPVLPTFPRAGAATIIIPTAAPTVTAAAPLGTLNLTPSTLIFLLLYLTLAE